MSGEEIRVWDPLVRIFHWSLVLAFFIAYVTEDDVMWLHELAGYTVLGLVAFRVIWGVVGTRYARFSNFIRGRAAVVHYLKTYFDKDAPRYIGHNPVGGWMIIAMLVRLLSGAWWSYGPCWITPSNTLATRRIRTTAPSAPSSGVIGSYGGSRLGLATRPPHRCHHAGAESSNGLLH